MNASTLDSIRRLAQRMERPISITLTDGDWCVIQGLLTGERNKVRDEGTRPEYLKTLEKMRTEIIRRCP